MNDKAIEISPEERLLNAIFGKQAPKPAPPKPKPPVAKPIETPAEVAVKTEAGRKEMAEALAPIKPKPKFVRKPHLTNRPFVGHEGLQALQKSMQAKPQRGQSRSNKEKK